MMIRLPIVLLCLLLFVSMGCVRMALRVSPALFPKLRASIFEECDPLLAENAIPANLKLMEGLLKNDPENRQILTSLSMGFSGYSLLFVEADDPSRASALYLRAKEYGIRALRQKGSSLKARGARLVDFRKILGTLGKKDLEPLLWATVSWNAWINLNLDKPGALAQLSFSQACLDRVLEIDARYLHGLPYILMGVSLSARPRMLGGNIEKARGYFERALELSDRKFLLAQYYFARYYAVMSQDRELFLKLIEEILDKDPHELGDICLINVVIKQKARALRKMADEFFI